MASTFVPSLVLETNNQVFFNNDGSIGQIMPIPTPAGGSIIDGDFWAVPVDLGFVGGFNFVACQPTAAAAEAPSTQSFHVVKISQRNSSDYYYLLGTSLNFIQASADRECCSETPFEMPTVIPNLAGCQLICNANEDGNYFAVVGIPTPYSNLQVFPYGFFNGVALPAASSTGYDTVADMLAFLNSQWSTVGTWTATPDELTLLVTQNPGPGTDELCVSVVLINPSA